MEEKAEIREIEKTCSLQDQEEEDELVDKKVKEDFVLSIIKHGASTAGIKAEYTSLSSDEICSRIRTILRSKHQKQIFLKPILGDSIMDFEGDRIRDFQVFLSEWKVRRSNELAEKEAAEEEAGVYASLWNPDVDIEMMRQSNLAIQQNSNEFQQTMNITRNHMITRVVNARKERILAYNSPYAKHFRSPAVHSPPFNPATPPAASNLLFPFPALIPVSPLPLSYTSPNHSLAAPRYGGVHTGAVSTPEIVGQSVDELSESAGEDGCARE